MTDIQQVSRVPALRDTREFVPRPQPSRLRFTGGTAFQAELRRRVDEWFSQSGKRRRDSVALYIKAVVILATFASTYVLLVFVANAWWHAVPLAILLGLATSGIGFNLMHDGGHGAFSRSRLVNRVMARTLDMIGGSSYLWHWKHGVLHHTYANITGHDADIAMGRLARLTPHQPRKAYQRLQHWYLWPLYGVMAVKWHFYDDFHDLLVGRIGTQRIPRPAARELTYFIAGKAAFFSIAFGIPMLLHAWWVVLAYYGLLTLVLGTVLSVVFQLAHCVEEAEFPPAVEPGGAMDAAWAVHQVETTVDFSHGNRVLAWLLGGLNYQIEHHLFPQISHVHYPALSKIVKQTCHEFGVRYSVHSSFWAGLVSHYRWLRRMGAPDPVS